MLSIKKTLQKILQSLTEVQKPMTLSRPLSENQKRNWTYTAPADGILYLAFASSERTYISVIWNDVNLPDIAIVQPANTLVSTTSYSILMKKGDTVQVNNLSENCFLTNRTAFVAYKFQG